MFLHEKRKALPLTYRSICITSRTRDQHHFRYADSDATMRECPAAAVTGFPECWDLNNTNSTLKVVEVGSPGWAWLSDSQAVIRLHSWRLRRIGFTCLLHLPGAAAFLGSRPLSLSSKHITPASAASIPPPFSDFHTYFSLIRTLWLHLDHSDNSPA